MELERGLVKTSAGYLHYRATGQGKPLILMHTNQRSSALYLELMAILGQGLRVVALDHPSHGMSDHLAGQPTIADYARYVTEVMDGLGVSKARCPFHKYTASSCRRRHSRERGNPGGQSHGNWMPACAGMTFYWRRTYEMDI